VSTVGTRWYTLAEAAPILGVSVDTVRRRVKRGQLEARQVHTQHGPTWEVFIGSRPPDAQADAYAPAEGAAQGAEGVEDRSQAMATWAASLLVPIAAELGEARQTIERQAETIRDQAERLGSLTEQVGYRERELTRSSVEIATLSNEVQMVEVSRWRYARSLALAVAVLVVGAVVAGMLAAPVWVR